MKKHTKIILGIVAAVLLAVLIRWGPILCLMLIRNEKSTSDISYYQALSGETDGHKTLPILGQRLDIGCEYDLPWLSELEPYEDCRFNYTTRQIAIFETHSYILILEYDADTYARQKEKLKTAYSYVNENLPGETSLEEHSPEFELDGFRFRAVGEDPYDYPKYMFFVGTSDETREVAYIYFHDVDLDYLHPTVADFLREETGWKEVVQ